MISLMESKVKLKGKCHEIFDFRFSTWISFPEAPDTGGKFATGVDDTGSKFATSVVDTG